MSYILNYLYQTTASDSMNDEVCSCVQVSVCKYNLILVYVEHTLIDYVRCKICFDNDITLYTVS